MSTNDRSLGELVQNVIAILMILAGLGGITSSIIGGLITILGGVILSSFMMDKILEFNDAIPKKLLLIISVILIVLGRMIVTMGGIEKEEQFLRDNPHIAEQREREKEQEKIDELKKGVENEVSGRCYNYVKQKTRNPQFRYSITDISQFDDGTYYVEVEYKLGLDAREIMGTTCYFDSELNIVQHNDFNYRVRR